MKTLVLVLLFMIALVTASCSKKDSEEKTRRVSDATVSSEVAESPSPREGDEEEGETEDKPESGDISEDCVAFLQSTKAPSPADSPDPNCPQCPAKGGGADVLKVDQVKVDRIEPAGENYLVSTRIVATFNPSHGGPISGGLTGWIPAEQRAAYERGETPAGQQVYQVNITYRQDANGWQPIDFSR